MSQTVFPIDQFGTVGTAHDAQLAFNKAVEAAQAAGGGIVEISLETTAEFVVRSSFPSVFVSDLRAGIAYFNAAAETRSVSGADSSPEAGVIVRGTRQTPRPRLVGAPVVEAVHQRLIHGGASLGVELADVDGDGLAVAKGPDAHWYPASIEGVAVGMQFDVNNQSGHVYTVKSFGWDSQRQLPYFTADAAADIPATTAPGVPSIIVNKTAIGAHAVITESHCPNQAAAQTIQHRAFSEGDTWGSALRLEFQGNIMSTGGDEGGIGYSAELMQDLKVFRGTVAAFDQKTGVLTYGTAHNTQRLGAARPLINLNSKKWITAGTVRIYIANGYPNAAKLGINNGVVQGVGTPWGNEVVGRYFAVDEPSEYLDPTETRAWAAGKPELRLRRWWRITKFDTDPDTGAQLLSVRKVMWGTQYGCPDPLVDVYDYYNYGNRELRYIIAPGAIVSDVRGGVAENDNMITGRDLVTQPNGDFTKPRLPFYEGDEIEQALGPQPWNPTGFRVRHLANWPSCLPDPSFLAVNLGTAPVRYGMQLHGIDDAQKQYRGTGVAFETGIFIGAVTGCGIDFSQDIKLASRQESFRGVGVPDAGLAIVMRQGGTKNRKTIAWSTRKNGEYATLGFDPDTGVYRLAGGSALDVAGARLTRTTSLSATPTPAQNLRGIGIPVPTGAHNLTITFPTPEADIHYGLFVTPSWITRSAVNTKHKEGCNVDFDPPPPSGATIDWLLVR